MPVAALPNKCSLLCNKDHWSPLCERAPLRPAETSASLLRNKKGTWERQSSEKRTREIYNRDREGGIGGHFPGHRGAGAGGFHPTWLADLTIHTCEMGSGPQGPTHSSTRDLGQRPPDALEDASQGSGVPGGRLGPSRPLSHGWHPRWTSVPRMLAATSPPHGLSGFCVFPGLII